MARRRRRKTVTVRATGWTGVLLLAAAGAALVALGWHPRPTDAAITEAIRACQATDLSNARITLVNVDRNWLHELVGRSGSRFMVTAMIDVPDKPRVRGCFRVQPLGAGAAFALGPYSRWHCYSPL